MWCRKGVNKGSMNAKIGQRRKEVRRENVRQFGEERAPGGGVNQNKREGLEKKEREGGESRNDEK